ncbi:MAG: hypothetical protein IJY88_02430 [Clostridia bacterium]|nr:hypothetical protein [Clostridia bacterium]
MTTDYPVLYAILNTFTQILGIITAILLLAAPFAAPAWFIVSITKFKRAEKGTRQKSVWRGNLIASSIVFGVVAVFYVFIAILIHIAQDAVIYM